MKTLYLRKSTGLSPLRLAFLLISLVFACFGFSPVAQAQLVPPPDGGYPGQNTAEGTDALFSLSIPGGTGNTANGFRALHDLTTGDFNTAVGAFALLNSLTNAHDNVAVGFNTMKMNTQGQNNTAVGSTALFRNKFGNGNTAMGISALQSNDDSGLGLANGNTAVGQAALAGNIDGRLNTAVGSEALLGSGGGNGNFNTAVGAQALLPSGPNSHDNVAVGIDALGNNTNGQNNTAVGSTTLFRNMIGSSNTAVGISALQSNDSSGSGVANFNTGVGMGALASNIDGRENTATGTNALLGNTGSFNTAIGSAAGSGTTGNWNIDIGKDVLGVSSDAFVTRIGISDPADPNVQRSCFIGGIRGKAVTNGIAVLVGNKGQLGTMISSSERFKDAVKPMDKASEAILALKPVTFRYKHELDPDGIPQFGLVAEQVEKVNPDLVARDEQGKPYSVRYEAVNAMLLNEFLKEHRTVQELKKQVAELTAGLQKVSAQVEMSRPAPQTVVDNH